MSIENPRYRLHIEDTKTGLKADIGADDLKVFNTRNIVTKQSPFDQFIAALDQVERLEKNE